MGASHQGLLCAPPPGRGDRGPRGGQELGPPPALLLPVDLHVGVAALDLGEDSGGKWGRSGGLGGAAPSVPPPSTLCAPPQGPPIPFCPPSLPAYLPQSLQGKREPRASGGIWDRERWEERGPQCPPKPGWGVSPVPPQHYGGGVPDPPYPVPASAPVPAVTCAGSKTRRTASSVWRAPGFGAGRGGGADFGVTPWERGEDGGPGSWGGCGGALTARWMRVKSFPCCARALAKSRRSRGVQVSLPGGGGVCQDLGWGRPWVPPKIPLCPPPSPV